MVVAANVQNNIKNPNNKLIFLNERAVIDF